MAKASLLVIQGIDLGARHDLVEGEIGIGRGAQNEFRILDTEASRTHARIHPVDGRFVLTDLSSANGTYVNGVPIRQRELANGDQIQVGRSAILFTQEPEEQEARSAAEKITLLPPQEADQPSEIVGEARTLGVGGFSREEATSAVRPALRTSANLQVLYRILEEAVRPSISMEQMLQRILDLTIEAVGADRGCILLRDPKTADVVPEVFSPLRSTPTLPMPVSRSIVDYVLSNRHGVRTSDARSDRRFTPGQSILQAGIREAMCVPMQGRYELMGVIYVDITTPPERVVITGGPASRFGDDLLHMLVAVGRQSALAIEDNRYQQALVKAERLGAIGQTITTLSHHIKNILQGVRGGSYLIDMGLNDHNEEMVRKGWRIVEKNQGKIYNLVMDMLAFSKERQPSPLLASVNETVTEVCELMQSRAEECNATIDCQLATDIPPCLFDPEGIHRAVLNIVTNAIDAVENVEGGKIVVRTGHDPARETVYVAVRDNGSGVPTEILPKLFDLFESTKGARGTGLGLAVSRKIIREHGGEITVESHPGKGSQFVLEWPSVSEDQASQESRTLA